MKEITKVQYRIIHDWLHKHYGKPSKCENKKCLGSGSRFEYALRHGFNHERKIENYIQLCSKCHRNYDMTDEKSKKSTLHLAGKYNQNLKLGPKSREKRVVLIDKGLIFNSIKELAAYLNCEKSSISHVLSGKRKSIYNMKVAYYEKQ